jgi:hypothetical protein
MALALYTGGGAVVKTLLTSTLVLATTLLLAGSALAKDPAYRQTGTLAEMNAVHCGTEENSGQGLGSVLLGTNSSHTKSKQMLCQEYTLKGEGNIVYKIRPTEEKHPVLLPIGSEVKYRLKKDRLLLSVPDGDGKERSYIVTSMQSQAGTVASR